MSQNAAYNSGLAAEQFLFYEIQIVAKMYADGKTVGETIVDVKAGNLFQYPTGRQMGKIARACVKHLDTLGNDYATSLDTRRQMWRSR